MSTADDRFERLVAEMLEETAPPQPPASLVSGAERGVAESRRMPAAWARLREPPMRHGSRVVVGSPSARWVAVMAATLLLVVAMVGAGIAGANLLAASTIVVDQSEDGDVTTIAEAVALATDGDQIIIRPGTYTESVTLDKDVEISGDGPRSEIVWSAQEGGPQSSSPTVGNWPYALLLEDTAATVADITFSGKDSAIHISGGSPYLSGLVMNGVGQPHTIEEGRGRFADAIAIYDHAAATVSGSEIRGGGAVTIYEEAGAVLESNSLSGGSHIAALLSAEGSEVRGNVISGSPLRAIGAFGGSLLIEENVILGADADGIQVGIGEDASGTVTVVHGNQISGAFTAISVAENAEADIAGNTISESDLGIWVTRGPEDLRVADNTLVDNDIGIRVLGGSGAVEDNRVRGGATGIQLAWDAEPLVTENTVEGATTAGLSIDTSSSGTVTGNRICGNATNIDVPPESQAELQATNDICEEGPAVIVVDQSGEGDAASIAEAVAMAQDGDEILVRPGTYVEAVVLDKDVALTGDGPRESVIWTAPPDGPTRDIGVSEDHPYAVLLEDSSATLADLSFSGKAASIQIDGGSPTLERLLIERVGEPRTGTYGTYDANAQSNAIVIAGPSRAVVRDNRLVEGGSIAIYDASEPLVTGNELLDGPSVFAFSPGDGAVVRDNVVRGSIASAISVFGPNRMTIEGNLISDVDASGVQVGSIHYEPGNDPTVRLNTIERARPGIYVASAAEPLVERNTVLDSTTGISVADGPRVLRAMDNVLADNDIGMSTVDRDVRLERNAVRGGGTGMLIAGGEPVLEGNTIEGVSRRGLVITGAQALTLDGNRVCGSRRNLVLDDGVESADIRSDNDICEDTAVE